MDALRLVRSAIHSGDRVVLGRRSWMHENLSILVGGGPLVPFSCRARGVCPSCNARRMAEVAVHLTDHVLPHLPQRQWVLALPKRLPPPAPPSRGRGAPC
jgi:hypothetical protein